MTVSLGGVVLSDSLLLDGLENAQGVAYSARRTIGGKMVVQVGSSLSGGRTLTLQGENDLTLEQIEAIKAIESAGQAVTLIHHRGTFTVIVVGVDVDQTFGYANPDQEDWYSGAITLIEV